MWKLALLVFLVAGVGEVRAGENTSIELPCLPTFYPNGDPKAMLCVTLLISDDSPPVSDSVLKSETDEHASTDSGITILGGASFFRPPDTGTYWNNNQSYVNNMTPAAFGLRYDTPKSNDWSYGAQYTYFGRVTMDTMDVGAEWPDPGGYNPATGKCMGTCAPLWRFVMQSEAQSVAFIATKHWGAWSAEAGINVYETRTSGYLVTNLGVYMPYKETTFLYALPMLGTAYKQGPWSIRLQVWWMPTKGEVPAAFTEDAQATLLAGYSF